jgi:UDP-N-acetylglucosamine--dolichyl-phosphate N-acetylglucosaminephosphotransferase
VFNMIELSGNLWKAHQFSLYFMLPYIGTTLALLKHNW